MANVEGRYTAIRLSQATVVVLGFESAGDMYDKASDSDLNIRVYVYVYVYVYVGRWS